MDASKRLATKTYRHFMNDSLRRNSSLLISSQAINSGAGFLFWLACARLYTANDVGLAVSLISFGTLISTFTNLGLPNTIVRFLPTSKKRGRLFTGSLYLVAIFSLFGAVLSILCINALIPKLGFVQSSSLLSLILVLLIVGNAVGSLMDGTLMAFKKGQYILGKALIINVPRVILPFFVVALGLRGIVGTYIIVLIFGFSYSIFVTIHHLLQNESLNPSLQELRKRSGFAAANYFGGMFGVLPGSLLPIIVLAKLGATDAAYFYMPMQIAVFINLISSSTSQALVAEASQTNNEVVHKAHLKNAAVHLYQILIPTAILFIATGWLILRLYGVAYANNGYYLLVLLCISSIFIAINWLGDTWLNIQKRSRAYFLMNGFNALAVVGFVYILSSHGLVGVGVGWLCGQLLSAIVYLAIFARSQLSPLIGRFITFS